MSVLSNLFRSIIRKVIVILLSITASLRLVLGDRLTSPDHSVDFGNMGPGDSSGRLISLVNPTSHDIAFTVALGAGAPTGTTVTADKTVVPAGSLEPVFITVSVPADADVEADYSFTVDINDNLS